jgi:hypothetical protein
VEGRDRAAQGGRDAREAQARGGRPRKARTRRRCSPSSTGRSRLPEHFGHNWDALADVLEDRDWLGKQGRVVVLSHAGAYRKDHPTDAKMLEEVLGEAAEFWQERHVPFWVFVGE